MNNTARVILLFAFAIFLLPTMGQAQTESQGSTLPSVSTDRPNITDAITLVPFHTLLIEGGIGFGSTKNDLSGSTFKSVLIPNIFFRYTFLERLEGRLFYNFRSFTLESGNTKITLNGHIFAPGLKLALWEENGAIPQAVLVGNYIINVSEDGSSSDNGDIHFVFQNTLSATWALAYLVGYSGSLNFTINPSVAINDQTSLFVEYYFNIDDGLGITDADGINLGLGHLVRNNLSVDLMVGTFLDSNNSNFFITAGFGWRKHP